MGQVWVPLNPHGSVQQSLHIPRKDVWTFFRFRQRTCLHQWPFACHKRILDRKSYCPLRYFFPPQEGWDKGQRRKVMLCRPQIWIIWLSRHLWRCYAHTKEIKGHSSPCSPKYSQAIAPVHRYYQLISWHVAKLLWASYPINFLNLQERQMWMERQAPKVSLCSQTCDMTWVIDGLTILQCSVWNI